jgi:2'-5' RNA ligase
MHLTLKFMGSIPVEEIPIVQGVLKTIASRHRAFAVRAEGLGAFPQNGAPQVIWAGIQEGEPELARIAGEVESALSELGYPREQRSFAAHLTLGRIKGARFSRDALDAFRAFDFGTSWIRELVLFESRTLPIGAVYQSLFRAALAA